MKRRMMRFLAALMLLAALMVTAPCALAARFEAVVRVKSMKVYDESAPHAAIGALPKGTQVTVLKYARGAALISWNGRSGIARVSDMAAGKQSADDDGAVETASKSELKASESRVVARDTKVYHKASTRSKSRKIRSGVTVNLLATNGSWAKIERGGAVGYIKAAHLAEAGSQADEAVENSTGDEAEVTFDSKAVVTTADCRVYARPNVSSASLSVDKGTKLKLLAIKGSIAKVKINGKVGYMDSRKLTPADKESTEETAQETSDGVFSGSNEEIIFKFLIKEMGYNRAAACGVLSNIKHESSYNPACVGDNGTSYGIAQWHLGRKTRLIDWCNSNGKDYNTLEGQLYFLKYELKTYYPAVHNNLKETENSAQGAYDAAYYFCYNFEAPANRESRSNTRGNYAKDSLWERYAV